MATTVSPERSISSSRRYARAHAIWRRSDVIAPLIVLVAQGLDGFTFLWAVDLWGIGAESNPAARYVYTTFGVAGLMVLKTGAAAAAAAIVHRASRWRTGMLLFASAAGILGAVSNLTAVWLA
jgi:hypothetical protein